MKKNRVIRFPGIPWYQKIEKMMKLLVLLLTCSCLTLSANTMAQQQRVTLNLKNCSVKDLFYEIQRQTDLFFVYNLRNFENVGTINVKAKNEEVDKVLARVFEGRDVEFLFEDNTVVVRPMPLQQQQVQERKVTGVVKDEQGNVLPGVAIVIKGTTMGTSTDADGKYSLTLPEGDYTLVFSFIGMMAKEEAVGTRSEINVTLVEEVTEMEEVVVTGIFTRKKESFTGSASTYTATDLKTMGTSNVLQSLKTLDPAFAIIENNEFGSDPNRLPNMEIRGKSSMLGMRDELDADPNQPLFILDGFESTLEAINDLDINRVASITILKDAASTAIYGSKAANGVVVVETVKPKPGELQVSYTGNLNLSMPDLTSYNLMNAREKLEFEQLAGRYASSTGAVNDMIEMDGLYNEKLIAINEGVDTYWLGEPLRVGVNHKHSLYVQGGEGHFLFGLGAGYNGNSGAMKESLRQVVSGNIDLIYRIDKFQFSNKFSMTNTNYTNPIVAFSEYAQANPYYKKYNDNGEVEKWLEHNDYFESPNPLWNASLNSRNEGKDLTLSNYFIAEYFPKHEWRFRARFGITYGNDDTEVFISPDDTRYDDVEIIRKGSYTATNTRLNQYEGEVSATFAKLFGKHQVNLVLGGNIYSSKSLTQGYSAQGFPEGDFTYPSFSNGYPENGSPTYYESVSRSVNAYFNAGYVFDDRYLMDFSLRSSGASVFGTSKQWNTTWSVGLGWNLHNEKFIKDNIGWINYLKIRASIGNPGNQSFDSAQTLRTYAFQYTSMNYFGLGAQLSQVGNPDLEWQVTLDKNIGIDITLLDKRLAIVLDYYHKKTDPLLIDVSTPLSSGTTNYMTNAGEQISKGLTASISYYIFQNFEERFSWMVRANLRTQKYEINGIGNSLESLNASGQGTNTVRYYDGADPDDIWAIRSAGIDPSTGKELFYTKDGNYTYDFSYDDEVICGNTRPDVEGVIGTSLIWKGFSLTLNFRYQLGADVFNEALYDKVENISTADLNYNQDKRALYERWQEPGDMVRFKNIASAATTPMSSRFVQREDVFTLESLNVGYEFYDGWIKRIGFSSLKFEFSMRDVFRASTIRSERGISYPFARTMEAGLSFNF